MSKHTPGPWRVSGRVVLRDGALAGWRIDSADGRAWVAETTALVPLDGGEAQDTSMDAALIAAAPDLLAALEAMDRHFTEGAIVHGHDAAVVAAARAAVKKARGG